MIVVDTSALVAIIGGEPEAVRFNTVLGAWKDIVLSAGTAVETYIVVHSRWSDAGVARLESLITFAGIELRSVDARQTRFAFEAHRRFGRGSGHPAKLNYGDCFAYALARSLDAPLLFKGDDFAQTDIRSALDAA